MQPPADRDVEALAEVIVDALTADPADDLHMEWLRADAERAAAALHAAGWRRVPEGHQVVPEPELVALREEAGLCGVMGHTIPEHHRIVPDGNVWLDGREWENVPYRFNRTHLEGEPREFRFRPVGAAGGEGTDGDD